MKQIFDWYGFPVVEYDDTCAVCRGDGATLEVNGVMLHEACANPFHETPEYQEEWRKYLNGNRASGN
ncbi:MAG TPA: hypothetical protein VJ742_08770 [Nitrososphaera sp.]|nr:hypothetical protein [Nitrososphaera sp.]